MGITSRLAQFVLNTAFHDLPGEAVTLAKEMMINAAAAGLAGAAQPEGRAITEFAQEMGGNGKCTIMGMGMRTSPVYAALANGTMIHLLDFDDEMPRRGIHPSSAILPVVTSLGEMNGYSGKESITAFVLGCEVAARLAAAGDLVRRQPGPPLLGAGHLDGIVGAVGAAAAAGKLLGLDQERLERCFGIACGQAGGIDANFATPARALQCGRAAMNGIIAAMLAQKGIDGARNAIEAPGGLLATHLGAGERAAADLDPPGRPFQVFEIIDPGVTLKLFPCDSSSHTTIEAALQLVQQRRIHLAQVASVRVSVTPATLQALSFANPSTAWEARFSLSYIVAATLVHGHPSLDQFTDAATRDAQTRAMMARITIEPNETPTRLIPQPSEIAITLHEGHEGNDGARLRHRVEFARGHAELPLAPEELDAKFLYCSRYILPPDHIQEAIDSFRDLDNIADITGLASVLGA